MQALSEPEIDLELELGREFRKERIARLQHIVSNLEKQHKNCEVARWRLVMAMCNQLQWERAWEKP